LVALDRTQSNFDRELTYAVPQELRDVLRVGVAVLVPVARQYLTGYVTGFTSTLDFEPKQLRPISRLLSRVPLFDGKALQVARWMSAYYHCALSDCLCCYVPQGSQQATEKRYVFTAEDWEAALRPLSRAPRQLQIAQLLLKSEKALSHKEIQKAVAGADVRDALKRLVEEGTISEEDELLDPTMKPRRVQAVRLSPESLLMEEPWLGIEKAAPRQAEALRKLFDIDESDDGTSTREGARAPIPTLQLARDWSIDLGALRGLEKKGFVEFTTVEQSREPTPHLPPRDTHRVQLTAEQENAVAVINDAQQNVRDAESKNPSVVLLQGVTASGKTEVYLHSIEQCLALGRRAVVLVPEIALTAQTVETFQRRFRSAWLFSIRLWVLASASTNGAAPAPDVPTSLWERAAPFLHRAATSVLL
jgi:primosomal protein N' (replication factor Y)